MVIYIPEEKHMTYLDLEDLTPRIKGQAIKIKVGWLVANVYEYCIVSM